MGMFDADQKMIENWKFSLLLAYWDSAVWNASSNNSTDVMVRV